jgi:hypothetical protein
MFKKLLISLLLGLTIFFSFAPFLQVRAQTWYNESYTDWYQKVYDPTNSSQIFGERYTAAQVQWVIYGLFAFIMNSATGPENMTIIHCLISAAGSNTIDFSTCAPKTSSVTQQPNTASLPQQSLWSLVFATDRPISGIAYVKEKVQNFSLVPVAHAQTLGFGFNSLQPIQNIWTAFRDVAFGLFVIVAIVFAFMIMFRVKLSPQVVISVQSALPKLVLALILVTFSYAIAGFLIDLMYVVIGLFSIIGTRFIAASPSAIFNFMTLGQPWGGNVQLGVIGLATLFITTFSVYFVVILTVLQGIVSGGFNIILGVIILIVGLLFALWITIKTIWMLVKAFATIILLTIFAPLQLSLGPIIPSLGFGAWLKSFVSNLSVFVVTGVLFMLSFVFLELGWGTTFSGTNWILSLFLGSGLQQLISGKPSSFPPLLGANSAGMGLLFLGVAFVVFTMIPSAAKFIQGFISGRPFTYGAAIGEATAPVGFGVGYAGSTMARQGALPWPISALYTRVTGKTAPVSSEKLRVVGETLQNAQRATGGK